MSTLVRSGTKFRIRNTETDDGIRQIGMHRHKIARVNAGVGRRDELTRAGQPMRIAHDIDVHALRARCDVIRETRTFPMLDPPHVTTGEQRFEFLRRHDRMKRTAMRKSRRIDDNSGGHEIGNQRLAVFFRKRHDRHRARSEAGRPFLYGAKRHGGAEERRGDERPYGFGRSFDDQRVHGRIRDDACSPRLRVRA